MGRVIDSSLQPIFMQEYIQTRRSLGQIITEGAGNTFWRDYGRRVVMRFPDPTLTPPSRSELSLALHKHRAYIASYNCEPDPTHPANAVLYLCRDHSYCLENLGTNARRDARRALRDLRIEAVDWNTLEDKGERAFRETRERFGLTDGTREHFQSRVGHFLRNPAHHVIAASHESNVLAFATVRLIDDWAEIEGMFSANEGRQHCPSNGIVHILLERCLRSLHCRWVSYGFSSIQDHSRADTLHQFKQKVGFEALPVHRAFVMRPWMRPAANALTLKIVRAAAHRNPSNKVLHAAEGMLSAMLPDAQKRNSEKEGNET